MGASEVVIVGFGSTKVETVSNQNIYLLYELCNGLMLRSNFSGILLAL